MREVGQVESADRFFDWCARVILGRPTGPWDARYQLDGEPDRSDWPKLQIDGLGLFLGALRRRGDASRWEDASAQVARWLEDHWNGAPATALLKDLHAEFGGQANLATLTADGTPAIYAGNTENPVFTFRLGRIGIASTGIYSLDRSIFRFVAPDATERRMVRVGGVLTLDRNGGPSPAS